MVDDEAGRAAVYLFDEFALHIVDFDLFLFAPDGVVGGKRRRLFKGGVGEFASARFYYHMGAGHFFGVKPPVVSGGELEGKLLVLYIIFADVNVEAVRGNIVKRLAFGAFGTFFVRGRFAADKPRGYKFFFYLDKVVVRGGNVERGGNRLEIVDLILRFDYKTR